jgi:hypothetical protein
VYPASCKVPSVRASQHCRWVSLFQFGGPLKFHFFLVFGLNVCEFTRRWEIQTYTHRTFLPYGCLYKVWRIPVHGVDGLQLLHIERYSVSRSQWPPGCLRNEWPLSAKTLGSWVRILLEAWKSAFIPFVLCFVCSGLATGLWLVQGALPTVYKIQISGLINSVGFEVLTAVLM